LSLTAAKALIKDEEYLEPVYNYWVKKHNRSCMNGLILTLKSEKKDASSPNDPYIAFRRRIEKMQTRKVVMHDNKHLYLLFLAFFNNFIAPHFRKY
jgi:enhancer of polycomb-like protein